jgi:hypothetical protein
LLSVVDEVFEKKFSLALCQIWHSKYQISTSLLKTINPPHRRNLRKPTAQLPHIRVKRITLKLKNSLLRRHAERIEHVTGGGGVCSRWDESILAEDFAHTEICENQTIVGLDKPLVKVEVPVH